jgi:hypothetical protein
MSGGQTPLGLSIRTGLGGPDLPFPQEEVRRRHVPPRWQLQGWPYHVPMAKGPSRDSSPTTTLNAGRWTGCAQVKSMACH